VLSSRRRPANREVKLMPDPIVVTSAGVAGSLLSAWALDPRNGGPLAGHACAEVRAFAGAGKTFQLTRAVRRALRRHRILVIAFTNAQVRDLARRLAGLGLAVFHLAADGQEIGNPPARLTSTSSRTGLRQARLVVATVYKAALTARDHPGDLGTFDLGFVDEAFQVRSTGDSLWALTLAPRWAFIGDPGQIQVFTTLGRSPFIGTDDPITSIVESARAQGLDLGTLNFDWTWRLPAHGAPILQHFYGQPVPAAALPGDREFNPGPRLARRGLARAAGSCTQKAARDGWAFLEIPGDALEPADSGTAEGVAAAVDAILTGNPTIECETYGLRPLRAADVGVAVSTDIQATVIAQALARLGHRGVDVRTYNRHQGSEHALTILWHPLSGVCDLDAFNLDLGRLCVGVSRHRHACVIVGRSAIRRLLADPPISPEAPWPGRRDRFLAGWIAHAELLHHLDRTGATTPA
jgi:hypothetical protein